MQRGTCLAYALDRWRRDGGYVLLRRSIHWPIPHVLHLSGDGTELRHFVPADDLRQPWHAVLGFRGTIVDDDQGPAEPISTGGVVLGAALLLVLSIGWAIRTQWREWRGATR